MIFSSVADILFCGKQANFFLLSTFFYSRQKKTRTFLNLLLSTFSTAGKKHEIMRQTFFQEKQIVLIGRVCWLHNLLISYDESKNKQFQFQ